jgi:hypothetical protein
VAAATHLKLASFGHQRKMGTSGQALSVTLSQMVCVSIRAGVSGSNVTTPHMSLGAQKAAGKAPQPTCTSRYFTWG